MITDEKNSCVKLLQDFEENSVLQCSGEILQFSGVNEKDVYNISAPFQIGSMVVISGRVESRHTSTDSQIVFFEEQNNMWIPVNNAPTFPLEDGFITRVDGETIFGGVEVYTIPESGHPSYRTAFYRGSDFSSLQRFSVGPDMMKDVRLIHRNDRIGVFARPQWWENGRWKIGYIELLHLWEITAENIRDARIIENQFISDEWGGANELHHLADNKIGVLWHIACFDSTGYKHYYAMVFVYDPVIHMASPLKIIATRKNFPESDTKFPELKDIIFPGGLVRHENGTATLYVGLSDAKAWVIIIPDPFV